MPERPDNLLDKLRKLIEHEKSARALGSLAEADAFAGKIAELCDRYRIALAEVPEGQRDDGIAESFWDPKDAGLNARRRQSAWQRKLAAGVAFGHYCELLCWLGLNNFVFLGSKADAEVASAMMTILCRAAIAACDNARKSSRIVPKDFLYGFAVAICWRYAQLRGQQQAQHNSATQALVRKTDQLIREKVEKAGIKKGRQLKTPTESNASMQAGFDAGMEADLSTKLVQEGRDAKQLIA